MRSGIENYKPWMRGYVYGSAVGIAAVLIWIAFR